MELKFRAWDKRFDHMIYQLPDGYRLAFNGSIQVISYANQSTVRESDEFIVMQFTGLTDKNGKDIYVGDRVKVWNGNKSFIGHDGFQFTVGKQQRRMDANEARDMEVIGNIYENPELI